MFLTKILRLMIGWVEWEGEGGFPERFLNLAALNGIPIGETKRHGILLLGSCQAKHYRLLRPIAKKSGMRLHITKRKGLPFRIKPLRQRWGLAVGVAVYIFLLNLFPQYIWSVQVRGNQTVSTDRIISVMADLGVFVGGKRTGFNMRRVQLQTIEELPELSWLAVNLKGSIAHIDVNERLLADTPPDQSQPTNLKATCDGRIISTRILEGLALVKSGDAVVEGMLLASGIVDTAHGPILKHARGEVMAETKRVFTTRIPLSETNMLPQEAGILEPSFRLFWLQIPLYTNQPIPKESIIKEYDHTIVANGVQLPIGFTHTYRYPLVPTLVERTPEEAALLAEEELKIWKENYLSKATIVNESKIEDVVDGEYELTVNFSCIENIAEEVPIGIQSQP